MEIKITHLKKLENEFVNISVNESFKELIFCDLNGKDIKKNNYHEKAQRAAESKKKQSEGNLLWVPIIIDDNIIGVIGAENIYDNKEKIDLIKGILDEYSYNEYLAGELYNTLDHKNNFLFEILTGNGFKNYEDAIDRGDILGLNLRNPQSVMAIRISGIFKKWYQKSRGLTTSEKKILIENQCTNLISKLESSFSQNDGQVIVACFSEDLFICLISTDPSYNINKRAQILKKRAEFFAENIHKNLNIEPTIGIGQYYNGFAGLKKSYIDAISALSIGERIWTNQRIYNILDIGMLISIESRVPFERKCELALQILGPVLKNEALFKTVDVFLGLDMSLSVAAKKLHLHRNTLIYRLDKIQSLIGLDPRKFNDAIQIKLGIILYGPSIRCS